MSKVKKFPETYKEALAKEAEVVKNNIRVSGLITPIMYKHIDAFVADLERTLDEEKIPNKKEIMSEFQVDDLKTAVDEFELDKHQAILTVGERHHKTYLKDKGVKHKDIKAINEFDRKYIEAIERQTIPLIEKCRDQKVETLKVHAKTLGGVKFTTLVNDIGNHPKINTYTTYTK